MVDIHFKKVKILKSVSEELNFLQTSNALKY